METMLAPGLLVRTTRGRAERFFHYEAGLLGRLVRADGAGAWLVKMTDRFAGTLVKVVDLEAVAGVRETSWFQGAVKVEDITTFGSIETIRWECLRCRADGTRSNPRLTVRQLGLIVAEDHGPGRCRAR